MTDTTTLLEQMFAGYPHSQLSEQTLYVYYRALRHIPAEDLATVLDQCVVQCRFLPSIAEIVETYRGLQGSLGVASAGEEWGRVVTAIERVGHRRMPNFENPITAKAVQAMGWRELCLSENQMADRAHFLRIYEDIRSRTEQVEKLTPQARQMLERKTGFLPIASILALQDNESQNEQ